MNVTFDSLSLYGEFVRWPVPLIQVKKAIQDWTERAPEGYFLIVEELANQPRIVRTGF